MSMGWRLDDVGRRLSWLDIKAMFNHRLFDSAVNKAISPDTWFREDPQIQMMAGIIWEARIANWQRAGCPEGLPPEPVFRVDAEAGPVADAPLTAQQVRERVAAVRARARGGG